jgi:hypothetical protein
MPARSGEEGELKFLFCFLVVLMPGACTPARESPDEAVAAAQAGGGDASLDPESGALAPASAFRAIEPTEVGITGAPTIWAALAGLGVTVPEGSEGNQGLSVLVRREGDMYVADVVRTGLLDDSVGSDHVRIEFRREPEGWFPTNAFRRERCRRGAGADQWSAQPCP